MDEENNFFMLLSQMCGDLYNIKRNSAKSLNIYDKVLCLLLLNELYLSGRVKKMRMAKKNEKDFDIDGIFFFEQLNSKKKNKNF
jgi:hypothetical protein